MFGQREQNGNRMACFVKSHESFRAQEGMRMNERVHVVTHLAGSDGRCHLAHARDMHTDGALTAQC